jgi:hypothetical protein
MSSEKDIIWTNWEEE